MKKVVKLLSLIVALVMVASCFAGCTEKESATSGDGDKTLSVWMLMDGNTSISYTNNNEMLLFRELEKRTGVHIDFLHPIQGSDGSEAFMTMITGKNRPDIVEYYWTNYTGGPQQALDDGVLVELNEYLEEYAPNYYDYMEGEKGKACGYAYKLEATTHEGKYYGFNALSIGSIRNFAGLMVRYDKLKEWGMDVPVTLDDWEAALAKAKEDGFDKPFTADNDVMCYAQPYHSFNTAFNVGKDLYLENGKVVFAPYQKGFKDFIALMADWTAKGYVDRNFVTNDRAKIEGNLTNGISIAAYGWISTIGKLNAAMAEKEPGYELGACPFPVAKEGEVSRFQGVGSEATPTAFAITTSCNNVELAVSWCDYFYSEEGSVLQIFGIEGDTYTIEEIDGEKHYVYTDKIKDYEKHGHSSIAEALYKYVLPANHPGLNQHPDYLAGYYPDPRQTEAVGVWNDNIEVAKPQAIPSGVSYTEEELSERTDILEVARTDLEIAFANIILGQASIDTYDDAVAKAKKAGYDRIVEIAQTAYDRYMSKSAQ